MLESLLCFVMITPVNLLLDDFQEILQIHAQEVINSSVDNTPELDHGKLSGFKYDKPKPGLKNSGFFCWLNVSLKLLFEMTDYNDILLSYEEIKKTPNNSLNLIRNIFIEMWKLYHNYDDANIINAEDTLEDLKKKLIEELHDFVNQNQEETYGLKEYFGSNNANIKQDSNLFIMAMISILKLDNRRHKLDSCTYIEAMDSKISGICRKIADDCPLIIHIAEDYQYQSLDDYLVKQADKIRGLYYWNATELCKQGINIDDYSDGMLEGNKFELVEANLNFVNNFIVYVSLNYTDTKFFNEMRDKIIKLILTDSFPQTAITVKDTGNLAIKKLINIVATAIICFKGSPDCAHYICLTLTDNITLVHDDEKVAPISDYLNSDDNGNKCLMIKNFLTMFSYTPYTILYRIE